MQSSVRTECRTPDFPGFQPGFFCVLNPSTIREKSLRENTVRPFKRYAVLTILLSCSLTWASPAADNTQMAVWVNEAIVATYTFNYKNFLDRQREIAKYFTATGWTAYSAALNASKLPDAVQKILILSAQ